MTRLLPIVALLLSACGAAETVSTTTTVSVPPGPEADSVVLVAELTGGCAMMGPNCERFVVFGDGTVEAYRAGMTESQPVDVGSIDPALVAILHRTANTTTEPVFAAMWAVIDAAGAATDVPLVEY